MVQPRRNSRDRRNYDGGSAASGRMSPNTDAGAYAAKLERVGDRIEPQPDGCWLWTGPIDEHGYGIETKGSAHRFVYGVLRGPIPGQVLHHTCFVRNCVNPDHLEPMERGDHIALHAALNRKHVAA